MKYPNITIEMNVTARSVEDAIEQVKRIAIESWRGELDLRDAQTDAIGSGGAWRVTLEFDVLTHERAR